jgi:hypothetical protein
LLSINGDWAIYSWFLISKITFKKRMVKHYTGFDRSANLAVRKVSSKSHCKKIILDKYEEELVLYSFCRYMLKSIFER